MNKIKHTKIIAIIITCLLPPFPLSIHGAEPVLSSNMNYIITYTPSDSTDNVLSLPIAKNCPVIQYLDGLGRPIQTIAVGVTPQGNAIISNSEYDATGRPYKKWIPFGLRNNGPYVENSSVPTNSDAFYNGSNGIPSDSIRYSLNFYDGTPLSRSVKTYGAGANWQNARKGNENYWYVNSQKDSLVVKKFIVNSDKTLSKNGNYADGMIYVTGSVDEDGHKAWTFTDKSGRTVLTRTYNGSYYSTYYVYDNLDQLVYVLSPMASDLLTTDNVSWNAYGLNNTAISRYGYYYRYDSHGNCIEKKLPGALPQYMVYDSSDRLVLSQDGNQRADSVWTFNKYDEIGRPIMKGSIGISKSTSLESLVSTYKTLNIIESYTGNTTNYGYSNNYFTNRKKLFEIYYYDHYLFLNSNFLPGTQKDSINWQSKEALDARYVNNSYSKLTANGLMTGSMSFRTDNQLYKKTTVYFYDRKGRVVQKNGTNHSYPTYTTIYGVDRYAYSYDFKGNIKHVCHRQSAMSYNRIILTEGTKFEYDNAGRLTTTKHYVGKESAAVTTSTNTYNELGQLASKVYGNNLETQTYAYNIRGWLKNISSPMFSEALYYEKKSSGSVGCYNGNIIQTDLTYLTGNTHTLGWKSRPTEWKANTRSVSYTYDKLNRMTNATTSNSSIYKEDISYDKNGNIGYLSRSGILSHGWAADGITPAHTYGSIDYLSYSYYGNQLSHVVEYNSVNPMYTGSQDFKNNINASSYTYDSNGNMTSNLDKNIPTIRYNYLNLPDTVQMLNGNMSTFYYDAITGAKTCASNMTYTGAAETMPVGSTLLTYGPKTYTAAYTYYYDNVIYEYPYMKKVLTTDGMLKNTVSSNTSPVFKRYYNIKDHLGNIRVVFDENGVVNQVNNYYPFGMEYGESAQDQTELTFQDYEFGGKEFNRKFEVNMYDFGARNYDATVGRWSTMDPLAEKKPWMSPYAYCSNNPILRIDPNGLTDFTFDKKTGDVKQVGEKNDDPDRILKTNRKGEVKYKKNGEPKVAVEGIEQGILKDGQNFKNKDQVIGVGGKGQPSVEGVKSFTLQLSEYVKTEITGFSYSSNGSGNVTDMVLGKYKNNTLTESYGTTQELRKKYGADFSSNNVLQEFHTHPNGEIGATQSAPEQSQDVNALKRDKALITNASFIILYRVTGQEQPAEYDYTHEYRP